MSQENSNGQRNPFSLQGLLRFAVEATRAEDAPNPSSFQEMDAERRQFLENAIKSMTIDVIEELEKAIAIIENKSSTESDLLDAMDVVLDFVDNIDMANDFCKVGGLNVITPCLGSSYGTVRSKAAGVLAEVTQNNPASQQKILELKVIPQLIGLLSNDETAASGLHAISCSIRNYEPSMAEFIDIGGLECLLGCLQNIDGQEKVIIKSLFLIRALCTEMSVIRDEFVKLGATELIVQQIHPTDDYSNAIETALATLILITENDDALRICQGSNLNLLKTLQQISHLCTDKPQCEEIKEYSESLLSKLFKNNSSEYNADR